MTFADVPADAPPPGDLQDRVSECVLRDLRPVAPVPSNGVLLAYLLLLALLASVACAWCVGASGWRALSPRQGATMFGLLGAGMAAMAWTVIGQMIPGARRVVFPPLAIGPVSVALAFSSIVLFRPEEHRHFLAAGLRCWIIGLVCAIVSGALLWIVIRRGAALAPIPLGASAGALAGLAGLTVLELHCPNLDRAHIIAWHLGAAVTAVFAGIAIGVTFALRAAKKRSR